MNVLQFITSLVSALIWPLLVAGLLFCWRESLTELFARIARNAKSVTVGVFSVELEAQLEQLGASSGLSFTPGGAIDAEHAANVREPVPLSADPVATILDSYERVRHAAADALTKRYGLPEAAGVPPNIAEGKLIEMYGPNGFGTPTLTDSMTWYRQNAGTVDEALALVTSELETINDAVIKISEPISAFSPKERVYATHYQAVAERVIKHFELLLP